MNKRKLIPLMLSSLIFSTNLNVFANENIEIESQQDFIHPSEIVLIDAPNFWTRINLWEEDLNQFRDAILQVHPRFWDNSNVLLPPDLTGFDSFEWAIWNELSINLEKRENIINRIDELISNTIHLTDFEIATEILRISNIIRDGHLGVDFPGVTPTHIFPYNFEHLGGDDGGFYLLSTTQNFENYLNKKIAYINDIPIEDILTTYNGISFAENRFDNRATLGERLSNPTYLVALGLLNNGEITFTLQDENLNNYNLTFTLDDLFLQDENLSSPVISVDTENLPRFLNRIEFNSFYILEDYGILYIVLENMDSMEVLNYREEDAISDFVLVLDEEILGMSTNELLDILEAENDEDNEENEENEEPSLLTNEFMDKIREALVPNSKIIDAVEQGIVTKVIIDGRRNPGGNVQGFRNLFTFLSENIEDGNLFYFMDNHSFSAASNAAIVLEYLGATLVGEPTGNNLIFFGTGDSNDLEIVHSLNNSNISLGIPNELAHLGDPVSYLVTILARDEYELLSRLRDNTSNYSVFPHIEIDFTIQDWLNNNDPLLSHIKESITN
ncbi:MAG: hypothetical protein FWF57_00950 [Defluviitaleaceae bacterium]|nr:hypothetical protein [Defluviitaleaceae bacterium]